MRKSIYKRCIRRWKVKLSNYSGPYWSEPFKSSFIRLSGITTAKGLVYDEMCNIAMDKMNVNGWSPELSNYIDKNRGRLKSHAVLNLQNMSIDDIDEAIEAEMDCWE